MNNIQFKEFVGNKVFSVDFIKADKTKRTYNARVNVHKHTKGGINPVEHKPNLVTIFEMDAQQYRTLNLNTVQQIRCNGVILTGEQL